jgi:hypothetical protein
LPFSIHDILDQEDNAGAYDQFSNKADNHINAHEIEDKRQCGDNDNELCNVPLSKMLY